MNCDSTSLDHRALSSPGMFENAKVESRNSWYTVKCASLKADVDSRAIIAT